VPQEDRPDRKVYHITQSGRAELLKWLEGPPPAEGPRSAPLIQVFFAGQLSDEEVLAKFMGFADSLRATLARFEQIPAQVEPYQREIGSPREYFFWMLTLDNGLRSVRATLEWAEAVIEQIKAGKVPAE